MAGRSHCHFRSRSNSTPKVKLLWILHQVYHDCWKHLNIIEPKFDPVISPKTIHFWNILNRTSHITETKTKNISKYSKCVFYVPIQRELIINDDSHPKFFLSYINPICASFFIKTIFKNFHFWKKSWFFWKIALWRPRTGDFTTYTVLSFEAS